MSEWRSDAKPPVPEVDPVEEMMAHLNELTGDEPICTVCNGEGCSACCSGVRPDIVDNIYERGVRDARRHLIKSLVDDAGALQVLVNEVEGCHDTAEDPGGCEVCTAVQIAKEWLQQKGAGG